MPVEAWKDPRHRFGVWGERVALAYLAEQGWMVEAQRFRLDRHDIDLIVRRDHVVAFVEVKARRTSGFGSGLEAVGWRKQRILAKVASVWCLRCGRAEDTYRFDVVAVHGLENGYAIQHVEDAWRLHM